MKTRRIFLAIGMTFMLSSASYAGQSAYVGLAGIGVQTVHTIDGPFSWGLKGEGGYISDFGLSGQGLLRFDLSGADLPLYLQLGLGAQLKLTGNTGVKPWGTLGIGAHVGDMDLLLQFPGYPIIGIEFPM
jgi:hypothetical protein